MSKTLELAVVGELFKKVGEDVEYVLMYSQTVYQVMTYAFR